MKLIPCGSVPTAYANEAYFTGRVLQTPIIQADEPSRVRALLVHFEPGARTAWHTHPFGQTLYIASGAGRVQVLPPQVTPALAAKFVVPAKTRPVGSVTLAVNVGCVPSMRLARAW